MDASTLLRRLNRNGVEVGLWAGGLCFKASEKTPENIVIEASKHETALKSALLEAKQTLRLKKDQPHAWLLRRGDPPLIACGTSAWCQQAMEAALKFGNQQEYQRWVILTPTEVGKLTHDDWGNLFAPNIRTPKGTPPAGPKRAPAHVLSVCKECREPKPNV